MKRLIRLVRAEEGAAAIETAFALPVFIVLVWGIFQFGVVFQGNAGMQHALGEGARMATLCINPTVADGCSSPTDAEIIAKMQSSRFGTGYGTFGTPTVTDGAVGTNTKILTVTFTMPLNFLLFNGPTVTMVRNKTVYIADVGEEDDG